MKKALTFSLLLCAISLFAQSPSVYDCLEEDKNIRTYPPEAYNPECGGQYINTFDWTAENWPVEPYNSYMNMDSIESPFYKTTNPFYEHLSTTFWKDHYPEDGWELIHGPEYSGYGHMMIVLYNRYTSTLRVFGSLYRYSDFSALNFISAFASYNEDISALYGRSGATFQTLDQPSNPTIHSSINWYRQMYDLYIVDIPVAYDPCTCNNEQNEMYFATGPAYSQYLHLFDEDNRYNWRISGRSQQSNMFALEDSARGGDPDNYQAAVTDQFGFWSGGMEYGERQNVLLQLANGRDLERIYRDLEEQAPSMRTQKEAYKAFRESLLEATGNADNSFHVLNAQIDTSRLSPEARELLAQHPSLGTTPLGLLHYFAAHSSNFNMPVIRGEDYLGPRLEGAVEWSPLTGQLRGHVITQDPGRLIVYPTRLPGHPDNALRCNSSVNRRLYPRYNQSLGRWAVLERPSVNCQTYQVDSIVATTLPCQQEGFQRNSYRFQYQGDIRFRFNPAAGIDQERTSLYAALQVRTPRLSNFASNSDCPDHQLPYFDSDDFFVVDSTANSLIWQSRLLPLACLSGYQAELNLIRPQPFYDAQEDFIAALGDTLEVELQIVANFVFDENNSVGERAQALQVYNISTNLEVAETPILPSLKRYPNRLELAGQSITQDTLLFAWDAIVLNDSLDIAPGVSVRLRSPNIVLPAAWSLPNQVQLEEAAAPWTCQPIGELSAGEVYDFCNSPKYRANEPLWVPNMGQVDTTEAVSSIPIAQVFPNPATAQVSIRYELSQAEQVDIQAVDVLGRVRSIFQGQQAAGEKQQVLDVSDWAAGVYYIRLQIGEQQQSIPFQVIH